MNVDYIINRLTYDGLPVDKKTIRILSFAEAKMFTEKMDESIRICILNDVETYEPKVLKNIFERSHIEFLICVGLGFGIYTYKDGVISEQPELPGGFVLVKNNTIADVNRKKLVNVKNESLPKPEFRLNNIERNCQSVSISFLACKNGLRCDRSFDNSGRLVYDCYCKLCDDYQKLLNKNEYGSLDLI